MTVLLQWGTMGIESITKRLRQERRDVTISTSITAADADALDEFVTWLNEHGVKTERAGAVRALVCDGLVAFREYQWEESGKKPTEKPTE